MVESEVPVSVRVTFRWLVPDSGARGVLARYMLRSFMELSPVVKHLPQFSPTCGGRLSWAVAPLGVVFPHIA